MNQVSVRASLRLVALGKTGQPYLAHLQSKGMPFSSVHTIRSLRAFLVEYNCSFDDSDAGLAVVLSGLYKDHPTMRFIGQGDEVVFGSVNPDETFEYCAIDVECVQFMLSLSHYRLPFIGMDVHAADLAAYLLTRHETVLVVDNLQDCYEVCGDLTKDLMPGTKSVSTLRDAFVLLMDKIGYLSDKGLFNYLMEEN